MDLEASFLSGKIQKIPDNILDLDPDWEIDPDALQLLEKIGARHAAPCGIRMTRESANGTRPRAASCKHRGIALVNGPDRMRAWKDWFGY